MKEDEQLVIVKESDLPKGKVIVFFAPHPDDAAISSGASLAALAKHNKVYIVTVSSGNIASITRFGKELPEQKKIAIRQKEAKAEARIIGAQPIFLGFHEHFDPNDTKIQARMKAIVEEIDPDIVFIPHKFDTRHITHRNSRTLALTALEAFSREHRKEITIFEFESPWSQLSGSHINRVHVFGRRTTSRKFKAISAHKSQIKRTPYHRLARSLANIRNICFGEMMAGMGKKPKKIIHSEAYHVRRLKP